MLPDYPFLFWMLAVTAVLLAGISKAGFGGGAGTIATPLMALMIPVADAAAIMLPLLIVSDLFSVVHYRSRFDRPAVCRLLTGAFAGIAAGAFFFGRFSGNEPVLRTGVGILAVVFVLFQFSKILIFGALAGRRPGRAEGVVMGAASGFMSTLVHAGGPPVAIYLLPQKMPRDLYVGTTVVFFTATNILKLIPYAALGLLHIEQLTTVLLLCPLAFAGVRLGLVLNRLISETIFNRIVYTIVLLTGLQLILGKNLWHLLLR